MTMPPLQDWLAGAMLAGLIAIVLLLMGVFAPAQAEQSETLKDIRAQVTALEVMTCR